MQAVNYLGRIQKMNKYSKILVTILVFTCFNIKSINAEISYSYDELVSVAGVKADISTLPSALWPAFIIATEDINGDKKKISKGTRGVLQRCEGNELIVDFGRKGLVKIDYLKTDLVERISKSLNREEVKNFPNLTMQVGNKLITFGRGKESGPIHMDEVKNTGVFIFLYLDTYDPNQAKDLYKFGRAYEDLKTKYPNFTAIIMAKDKAYYDFGYTIGYNIPFITPHVRKGYMDSLYHQVSDYPCLLLADPNGRILYLSEKNLSFENLSKELKNAVRSIGINLRIPSRSVQWRIRRKP